MEYILLGVVVVTYLFLVHIQPYLELWFEACKNRTTFRLEREQLELEKDKCVLMKKYPEMYKGIGNTVIEGFQHVDEETYYEEIEDKKQ